MREEVLREVKRRVIESERLYTNFMRIRRRDRVKASEFLWGSVCHLTYALGLLHGKKLGRHRELVKFLKELVRSYGRSDLIESVQQAEGLHANYYHGWMSEDVFEVAIRKVDKLRIWLKTLIERRFSQLRA